MRTLLQCIVAVGLTLTSSAYALQERLVDEVAIVVNDGVVLESEIDQLVAYVKNNAQKNNQSLPRDEVLRTQASERLILQTIQMQMAERMGIQISDAQLDQTLANIARDQNATLDEMREDVTADGTSWSSYRENIRTELIAGEVQRAQVRRRVYITPQEVNNLVQLIENSGDNQVEYNLGHILISIPESANPEQLAASRQRAESVLERLKNGENFAELAITASSGSKALEGGDLGWMSANEMPTLFAEVVNGKRKGDLVGPLRSGVGFHILKVQDTRGQQTVEIEEVKSRHILIQPSVILSDERAREMLNNYRQQILDGEADFAELARKNSADTGSASRGGELGWSRPEAYAPEFKQKVESLPIGEISEPFHTQFGWHIVQVEERRTQDATAESKQDRAYQMLFSRKYREELDNWMQEIRDQAYVHVVAE
ncbi:peptidylprolyl isomerase SurA [Idiomarina xiamenensis]|uniref:Chaperone SurA n=1 Tax=Idiomarina xiamenensis 10-D-4 TaxID=740709 RepID=K2KLL2_9GAMM|nr:peptidylprolyl isomerase SurA [Idiomarina xiamenensis]EKE87477.1 PpiC-type peptidyl-prolyl cis-trans isomerase [Idiomarina xiamenensis 10-D-4]